MSLYGKNEYIDYQVYLIYIVKVSRHFSHMDGNAKRTMKAEETYLQAEILIFQVPSTICHPYLLALISNLVLVSFQFIMEGMSVKEGFLTLRKKNYISHFSDSR